ncbi:hypothetical protein GTP46_26735 [Duganella sp. FT135W]|uniref:Uncharacterized protein n=1 Tax=Duganella flavida TaxID=2692175 RepID=A0A6L8KNW0_9BURK|nr:DUF169 domain-containing protein [Duganella flavida]MYM26231.1 hypothetical protein [Duganella flavida]
MTTSITTYSLADVLDDEPRLQSIISALRVHHNAYALASGSDFPVLVNPDDESKPVVVIASERFNGESADGISEFDMRLDACDTGSSSRVYATWGNDEMAFGIPADEFADILAGHPLASQILILWATNTKIVQDFIDADDEFRELADEAGRQWHRERFVRDTNYAPRKHAPFPLLLSSEEQRVVSSAGLPVYVLSKLQLAG